MTVLERIEDLLGTTPYRRVDHAPTFTSQEAADARGESVMIGGKSLVMKIGRDRFGLFVVSGGRKTHGRTIRKHFGVDRLRFATRDELRELTGLEPGCVPPFTAPIFDGLALYVDQSIADNDRIAFNPGDHAVSIIMPTADYLRLAGPTEVFAFSRG